MTVADLAGRRFERLTVLRRDANDAHGNAMWVCECDCGAITVAPTNRLNAGRKRSCGCLSRETTSRVHFVHGQTINGKTSRTYRIWKRMKGRCSDKKDKQFYDYGGRGITVCQRWNKFQNFLEDMGECADNLEIDRVDNSMGYFKENCRYVTRSQNQRNRRNSKIISAFGKTMTQVEWSELTGVSEFSINWRINHGWAVEEALTKRHGRMG